MTTRSPRQVTLDVSVQLPAAASALVCAVYRAVPERTKRCRRAPLNDVAAIECTGRRSSG